MIEDMNAQAWEVLAEKPHRRLRPRRNPHSCGTTAVPNPRFPALALFGRRPSECVERPSSRQPKTCTDSEVGPLERYVRSTPTSRRHWTATGVSVQCQCTKSLRSSPLRGSKSREADSQVRGQRWRGGKVNTISSCIVGVQRMIKNSKDHLAGRHPDAASHIDPAITQ